MSEKNKAQRATWTPQRRSIFMEDVLGNFPPKSAAGFKYRPFLAPRVISEPSSRVKSSAPFHIVTTDFTSEGEFTIIQSLEEVDPGNNPQAIVEKGALEAKPLLERFRREHPRF